MPVITLSVPACGRRVRYGPPTALPPPPRRGWHARRAHHDAGCGPGGQAGGVDGTIRHGIRELTLIESAWDRAALLKLWR
jgi:hypothetical protein